MAALDFLVADWSVVSARLDEALALAPERRSAWLAAIEESPAVKEGLQRLLAEGVDRETAGLLDHPPSLTLDLEADFAIDGAAIGAMVGPYRLLDELGRGGMGSVWLAERSDAMPRRKIALKLPHVGWSPGFAQRLARERDILASLEHPHIARLYDAGVDRLGRPWLALEYVDGVPIDRYCKVKGLSIEERLLLILQIASAVAHAHTRLVVHRDLKPSNILVSADGNVHLLDFGIAKLLLDDGGVGDLTRAEGCALTPDYASPEQIRGEVIGTASDVYSLGVVTYEVLAGVRPYVLDRDDGVAQAWARDGVEAAPASAAALDPSSARELAGDLDAILAKALRHDADARYPTIDSFAADIERHRAGLPVQARPDSLVYRAHRFVRRHAVQVGAAAFATAALVGGSAVAIWQAREARFEATRAEQVKDFALSIFDDADTDSGGGPQTTAAQLLESAKLRVQNELAGRPEVAVELMTAIGYSLIGQGQIDEASELLRQAVELGQRKLGPRHLRTVAATVVYAEALVEQARPRDALALLEPAIDAAASLDARHEWRDALRWRSSARIEIGDTAGGLESARAAVALIGTPDTKAERNDAIAAWGGLANALNAAGEPGQADAALHSLKYARELYGDKVTASLLAARSLYGKGLVSDGRGAEGLSELAATLDASRRVLGAAHPQTHYAIYYLANASLEAGANSRAVEAFREGAAASDAGASIPAEAGKRRLALGLALAAAHHDEEALSQIDAGIERFRSPGANAGHHLARALSARLAVLVHLGRLGDAEKIVSEIDSDSLSAVDRAVHAGRLATLRSAQGRHDEAVALARSSVEGLSKSHSATLRAHSEGVAGAVLLAAGRPDEAVVELQRAVDLYGSQVEMSPDRADAVAALTQTRARIGLVAATLPASAGR